MKTNKIQFMLMTYLKKYGNVEILLPDGITLEIGIMQTDVKGKQVKSDHYCYVKTTKEKSSTLLDSYNLGLSFMDENTKFVYDDRDFDEDGTPIRRLAVI